MQYALDWLATYPAKRAMPIKKWLNQLLQMPKACETLKLVDLFIKEIRVDQGPMIRYFKPGAMGRANI